MIDSRTLTIHLLDAVKRYDGLNILSIAAAEKHVKEVLTQFGACNCEVEADEPVQDEPAPVVAAVKPARKPRSAK